MHSFLKRRFAVLQEEELHMGGFIPTEGALIQLGFRYRGGDGTGDIIDEPYARTLGRPMRRCTQVKERWP